MKKTRKRRGRKPLNISASERKARLQEQQKAYSQRASKFINVRFSKEYDKELLAHLETIGNKTEYLRKLILNDIHNNKEPK